MRANLAALQKALGCRGVTPGRRARRRLVRLPGGRPGARGRLAHGRRGRVRRDRRAERRRQDDAAPARARSRAPGSGNRARLRAAERQGRGGARIGYLPQRARLVGEAPVTVREVVSTGRLAPAGIWGPLRRADREAVARAIETVGLADRADAPLRTLSGGMQQRALIAKALASEPTLLALDEPTTGVDAASQESLGAPPRGAARAARRHDPLRLARVRRGRARRRPDRARPRRHRLRRASERASRRLARPSHHHACLSSSSCGSRSRRARSSACSRPPSGSSSSSGRPR